jgi:VRR-NUC domain
MRMTITKPNGQLARRHGLSYPETRRQVPFVRPEREYRDQIVRLARVFGWATHFTWNSMHSPAGFPDLLLLKDRRLIVAELKSSSGKLTRAQNAWLDHFEHLVCAEVYIWRDGINTLDEIAGILRRGARPCPGCHGLHTY